MRSRGQGTTVILSGAGGLTERAEQPRSTLADDRFFGPERDGGLELAKCLDRGRL